MAKNCDKSIFNDNASEAGVRHDASRLRPLHPTTPVRHQRTDRAAESRGANGLRDFPGAAAPQRSSLRRAPAVESSSVDPARKIAAFAARAAGPPAAAPHCALDPSLPTSKHAAPATRAAMDRKGPAPPTIRTSESQESMLSFDAPIRAKACVRPHVLPESPLPHRCRSRWIGPRVPVQRRKALCTSCSCTDYRA